MTISNDHVVVIIVIFKERILIHSRHSSIKLSVTATHRLQNVDFYPVKY